MNTFCAPSHPHEYTCTSTTSRSHLCLKHEYYFQVNPAFQSEVKGTLTGMTVLFYCTCRTITSLQRVVSSANSKNSWKLDWQTSGTPPAVHRLPRLQNQSQNLLPYFSVWCTQASVGGERPSELSVTPIKTSDPTAA